MLKDWKGLIYLDVKDWVFVNIFVNTLKILKGCLDEGVEWPASCITLRLDYSTHSFISPLILFTTHSFFLSLFFTSLSIIYFTNFNYATRKTS